MKENIDIIPNLASPSRHMLNIEIRNKSKGFTIIGLVSGIESGDSYCLMFNSCNVFMKTGSFIGLFGSCIKWTGRPKIRSSCCEVGSTKSKSKN